MSLAMPGCFEGVWAGSWADGTVPLLSEQLPTHPPVSQRRDRASGRLGYLGVWLGCEPGRQMPEVRNHLPSRHPQGPQSGSHLSFQTGCPPGPRAAQAPPRSRLSSGSLGDPGLASSAAPAQVSSVETLAPKGWAGATPEKQRVEGVETGIPRPSQTRPWTPPSASHVEKVRYQLEDFGKRALGVVPLESLVSRFVVRCSASIAESWLLALSPLQERVRLVVCAHSLRPSPVHVHLASVAAQPQTGCPAPLARGETFPVAGAAALLAERVPGRISQSHPHTLQSLCPHTSGEGAPGPCWRREGEAVPLVGAQETTPGPRTVLAIGTDPSHRLPWGSALHTWGIGGSSVFKGQRHNSQLSSLEGPLAGQNQLPWLCCGCPECGWTRVITGALGCELVTVEGGGWAGKPHPQVCTWAQSQGWQHLGTVPGPATGVGLSNPAPWLCDLGQLSEAL